MFGFWQRKWLITGTFAGFYRSAQTKTHSYVLGFKSIVAA
jgi:hypothetical protein